MSASPPDLTSAVILAVDDEPSNLALLRQTLSREGYDALHLVGDPREALPTFERVRPDLVLLDLQMPHLDGFAVMGQLSEVVPDGAFLPVLVLTADTTPETRWRALAGGATDFLTKPLDTAEVLLRVRNLLHTRRLYRRLEEEKRALETRVQERTAELRRANEALVAADQLKNDFIAMASHEMRTPLTVLKGFTSMLLRRWEAIAAGEREEHLQTMDRNVERLERLVGNLLLAARIEDVDRDQDVVRVRATTFDLGELLQRTISDSPVRDSDVALDCPPGHHVVADPGLVQQVVDNLLTNAAKYGTPPVEVGASIDPGSFELVVRDHGPGVSEGFVPQLFDRFTQASTGDRRTATGTGLGLWVARGLARLHGGDLWYEPAEPGARFHVRIGHGMGEHTVGVQHGTDIHRNSPADGARS